MTHKTTNIGGGATNSTWLSVLGCGVIAGAAMGILFAPARGRETRRGIARAVRVGRARAAYLVGRCRTAFSSRQAQLSEFVRSATSRP